MTPNSLYSLYSLIEQGIRVKWLAATALVQLLQQAKQALDLMGLMSKLDKYQLLIIDDIGYVKKTDSETQVAFTSLCWCHVGAIHTIGLVRHSDQHTME